MFSAIRCGVMSGGGGSSIAYIGQATTQAASGTTVVINKPTSTEDGDLMVAFMAAGSGPATTWTGASGWTEVADQGANPSIRVAWKIAASEGSSYTFTAGSSSTIAGTIATFRGAVIDVVGSIAASASANTISAPSITVTNDGSVLLFFGVQMLGATLLLGAPTGMTSIANDNGAVSPSYNVSRQAVDAGATGVRTTTFTSSVSAVAAVLLSLKQG